MNAFCFLMIVALAPAGFSAEPVSNSRGQAGASDDTRRISRPGGIASPAWTRHTIDDSSKGADGVRLADVNGDGVPDIVTGWEEGGVVRICFHPGPDHVRERWPAVTVGNVNDPEDAVAVDLDGDGALDVVSSCEGRTQTMFVHWGTKNRAADPSAWKTEPFPATQAGRELRRAAISCRIWRSAQPLRHEICDCAGLTPTHRFRVHGTDQPSLRTHP